MATNEVLKFIVFAAGAISGGLGVLTGLIAFGYRKQVLKAERKRAQAQLRRFQKERRPDHPAVQDAQNAAPVI